ncbi:Uncharacterised protein [Bordetella pertussis]|nr:Uncharacterised protein [Bordetella pertussis]
MLDGLAQVREASGVDVSAAFVEGARQLDAAQAWLRHLETGA